MKNWKYCSICSCLFKNSKLISKYCTECSMKPKTLKDDYLSYPPKNTDQQPLPKKNKRKPIVDMVIEDMKERKKKGIAAYGTPLQAHNGRDALQDALEEALDLVFYLKQAIEERK